MRAIEIWHRITEVFGDVSRDLGRTFSIITRRSKTIWRVPTYSWGRSDYSFWQRAYYCKVAGLEVSGLFIRPIVHKIPAWVLGRLPKFILTGKRAQKKLEDWFAVHHEDLLRAFEGSLKQGDSFFVINSDLSITLLPPESVDPIVNEQNYGELIGWRVKQTFPHPDNGARKMTITDEYYKDRRVHSEEFSEGNIRKTTYPNIIGIIPIVHVANHPAEGEQFGHPEAEALLDLFHRYGQILEASVEGNILQGRPTPVIAFSTVQDLNAFWRRYGSKTTARLPDGSVRESESISIDMSDVLTLSGAKFSYESPGSFAQDAERILGLLFYLILEHLEIPEFVLGNAIEGSKASAETQMPVFEVFITARQKACTPWILETCAVVQAYLRVLNPGFSTDVPLLQWDKLTQNGRLVLDTVNWAFEKSLLDEKTALTLLPLEVEDPEGVLRQAKKDAEKRREQQMADLERQAQIAAENSGDDSAAGAGHAARTTSRAKGVDEMDSSLRDDIEELNLELS